ERWSGRVPAVRRGAPLPGGRSFPVSPHEEPRVRDDRSPAAPSHRRKPPPILRKDREGEPAPLLRQPPPPQKSTSDRPAWWSTAVPAEEADPPSATPPPRHTPGRAPAQRDRNPPVSRLPGDRKS